MQNAPGHQRVLSVRTCTVSCVHDDSDKTILMSTLHRFSCCECDQMCDPLQHQVHQCLSCKGRTHQRCMLRHLMVRICITFLLMFSNHSIIFALVCCKHSRSEPNTKLPRHTARCAAVFVMFVTCCAFDFWSLTRRLLGNTDVHPLFAYVNHIYVHKYPCDKRARMHLTIPRCIMHLIH